MEQDYNSPMSSKSDSQKSCLARFWFLHQVYSVIEVEFISKPKDQIETRFNYEVLLRYYLKQSYISGNIN